MRPYFGTLHLSSVKSCSLSVLSVPFVEIDGIR